MLDCLLYMRKLWILIVAALFRVEAIAPEDKEFLRDNDDFTRIMNRQDRLAYVNINIKTYQIFRACGLIPISYWKFWNMYSLIVYLFRDSLTMLNCLKCLTIILKVFHPLLKVKTYQVFRVFVASMSFLKFQNMSSLLVSHYLDIP